MKIVDERVKNYEMLLRRVDYDFTKVSEEDSKTLDDPTFKAASDRVDAYGEKVCGIKSDS